MEAGRDLAVRPSRPLREILSELYRRYGEKSFPVRCKPSVRSLSREVRATVSKTGEMFSNNSTDIFKGVSTSLPRKLGASRATSSIDLT